MDLPFGNVTFFASKEEVPSISLLVTSRFLHQRRLVGPSVGHVTFFCTKGGLLGPRVVDMMFSGPQLGVGPPVTINSTELRGAGAKGEHPKTSFVGQLSSGKYLRSITDNGH